MVYSRIPGPPQNGLMHFLTHSSIAQAAFDAGKCIVVWLQAPLVNKGVQPVQVMQQHAQHVHKLLLLLPGVCNEDLRAFDADCRDCFLCWQRRNAC